MEEATESIDTPESDQAADTLSATTSPSLQKTPLYSAYCAPRYQRQDLIKDIQAHTGRKLITYVAGARTAVDREDVPPFVDLLHNISRDSSVDLLLHTGGGDIDAAEKLVSLIRSTVRDETLRVIVPDYAKSAGTLVALGANEIMMSDSSELGPVDPQIVLSDANGNRIQHSVFAYLAAYDKYSAALKANPDDQKARIMMAKLEPQTVKLFQRVLKRTGTLVGNFLQRHMLKGEPDWTLAQTRLMDLDTWLSHGQPIMKGDALEIGLKIDSRPPEDPLWQALWRLYCLQRRAITEKQKLFESEIVSLPLDSEAIYG